MKHYATSPPGGASSSKLRKTEITAAVFFTYATVWSWVLPIAGALRWRMVLVNAAVVALAFSWRRLPTLPAVAVVRDWAPSALILLAYKEMGWLAVPQVSYAFENYWVQWDRWLLADMGLKRAVEVAGPLGSGFLEFCYLMVYPMIPLALGAVYWHGRPERMERLTFPLFLACLCTYGLFPFFPSDTPRRVFPGDLFPAFDTIFRQINWWLCEGQGIHTSVFPSGHVSSAIACAVGLHRAVPEARRTSWIFAVIAAGIFLATIYGRYHYAVDSVAGAAIAAIVLWWTRHFKPTAPKTLDPGPPDPARP
jgi:membrane-associated phospholipid phosphatase